MVASRGRKKDPIAEFWAWWPTVRPAVTAAIGGDGFGELPAEFSKRVTAIHKGLNWALSPGREARHALVVTASGNAELRAVAARWGAQAPAADEEWEFHTTRQPDRSTLTATMEIGGGKLDLAELQFAYEVRESAVDVVGYHPKFRKLPETVRGQVTFLALDWLLGEDGVEIWVGAVDFKAEPPAGATDPLELAAAVDALRAAHTEPRWVQLRDGSSEATAQRPLRSARWPRFDTHVAVRLPDDALPALRAFEDLAMPDGVLVAHETAGGTRTFHFYVDGETAAAEELTAAAERWQPGTAAVTRSHDPAFKAVAALA